MKLRPSAPGEAAALAELWFESWSSNGFEGPSDIREQLVERVQRELAGRWEVTVAEANGRLLGFVALATAEQRLDQLFIAPDAQGRGVGSKLFGVAVQRFPNGFWLKTQTENLRACNFYERRGMVLDRIEDDRVFYKLAPGA